MSTHATMHALEYVADQVSMRTYVLAPCVGDYKFSAYQDDVKGWLKCDGRVLQQDAYPNLYTVIGTAFGSSGAGTFRLPNCMGRVPAAIGASTAGAHALGDVLGAETHTLTESEMPSHTHTGTTQSAGTHTHTGTTQSAGNHNHGGQTGTSSPAPWGQGIAALGGGNDVGEDNGAHSHSISSDGEHAHTFTSDSAGAHTHTFTTDATGGGAAHNNMQPTIYLGNVFIFAGNARLSALLPLQNP